jgi:insulysin
MSFRFQERSQPLQYAVHLACQLNRGPPELVVSGSYLMRKWCPELIAEIVDALVPENLVLHQTSKTYAPLATQREQW